MATLDLVTTGLDTTANYCFGDSISAGWGGILGWPHYAAKFHGKGNINFAVGGYWVYQVRRDMYAGPAVSDYGVVKDRYAWPPQRIIFGVGANDLANDISATTISADIAIITDWLDDRQIDFRIFGILPFGNNSGLSNGTRLTVNSNSASAYGSRYIDVDPGMGDGGNPIKLRTEYDIRDGPNYVHLTEAGEKALAAIIAPEMA